MVRKGKNSAFNRDAFSPSTKGERVTVPEDIHHATVKHHKSSAFMWGLVIGFVLNTLISITLVTVYVESNNRSSEQAIDGLIKTKIDEIGARLESMENYVDLPESGEEAKAMNESSGKPIR